MRPRCLVADDHPALTWTVCAHLSDHGFDVVGPAADGRAALSLAIAEQPDVALIDFRMPRLAGIELIKALREAVPTMPVCVYTADGDTVLATSVLEAGAAALLLKASPLADLDRALNTVLADKSYVDPAVAQVPVRGTLTARELDVLRLLADGHHHEEIGQKLGIGAETVRTHLRKACARLGAATRTEAVATALRQGLIV